MGLQLLLGDVHLCCDILVGHRLAVVEHVQDAHLKGTYGELVLFGAVVANLGFDLSVPLIHLPVELTA